MSDVDGEWLCEQLDRARSGDRDARNLVFEWSMRRMLSLADRMLKEFPKVRRWEDAADIVQSAMIRLQRALKVIPINSPANFFGLAATQIRRELLDCERHYSGPEGLGANYDSVAGHTADNSSAGILDPADGPLDPDDLSEWGQLHKAVEQLEPQEPRDFFARFLPPMDANTNRRSFPGRRANNSPPLAKHRRTSQGHPRHRRNPKRRPAHQLTPPVCEWRGNQG